MFRKSLFFAVKAFLLCLFVFSAFFSFSQFKPKEVYWTEDGKAFLEVRNGHLLCVDLASGATSTILDAADLTPPGHARPLTFNIFSFSGDGRFLLVFTNTARVWRYNIRGDYWVLDLESKKWRQLGKGLPSQSLMFAKFSPNSKKVGYVSNHNVYSEDIVTGNITQLTHTGTRKFINGTFDWVYEEEFGARDGFRWSDNSNYIAFWQVDATRVRDYFMLNTTDSVYSQVIPVEYPKVGQPPSPVELGVVDVETGKIVFMDIPGDPQQHYIPRMEWVPEKNELVLQQLNRKQNISKLYLVDALTGKANLFYTETDDAFIDIKSRWNGDDPTGWDWISKDSFLWVSEKDGYRGLYILDLGGREKRLTGDYDIAEVNYPDLDRRQVYFTASPSNPTQRYLYRVGFNGGKAVRVTPSALKGTHHYNISPKALYALHTFSNYKTLPAREWIDLQKKKATKLSGPIEERLRVVDSSNTRYFQVTTIDGITVDGWMTYPVNFDSTKKYPVVFYVYGEPASSTINDRYGSHNNFLFNGDMSLEGYFQISVDNRGTPSLRGREWRKSIYRKLGRLNIRDQAMAAKKILEKPWFDRERVAVWGWSGGGSSTMNLMFQYPEIYGTGIAIAAVTNLLFYDNVYEERYMGLPQENMEDYIQGSPVTYARNLQGNLLFIHGTGDDNVHYDNAEVMLNELVKWGKQFEFMAYPNRSHSISEGEGTEKHLSDLYSRFLRKHCPPGPRPR